MEEYEEYPEEFGELALVIGDFHIPMRASDIPEQFKELLVPNKVQYVFCTGNIGCREVHDWIKSLSNNTHIVKGDFDEQQDLQESKIITIGNFKIGLIHGHQVIPWGDDESLLNELREMDCDILISGHTHDQKITKLDKKYLLNPGSVTGAYNSLKKDINPGFMLLEFKEKVIEVYLYSLVNNEVKIEKTLLAKNK